MTLPAFEDLGVDELAQLIENLDQFSAEEQAEIEKIIETLGDRVHAKACSTDLIAFCCHMQPDYKVGKHHRILATLLMDIA